MEKPKITLVGSEDYQEGRIDTFGIKVQEDIHYTLISLFTELGFPEEEIIDKLDTPFEQIGNGYYAFIYGSSKIKAHLIIEKDSLIIKFDTTESREKINKIFDKYFEFIKSS